METERKRGTLKGVEIKKESKGAYKVSLLGVFPPTWIAKSICIVINNRTIKIPHWLAKKLLKNKIKDFD